MKEIFKKKYVIIIILGLIVFSSLWLVFYGLPWQHDVGFHIGRIFTLNKTIQNGDLIALIHDSCYGYGYALGIFYSNLFLYIPAMLLSFGLSSIAAYKIFIILINIGTVLISYYAANKITKHKNISLLFTILYVFSEYRLYDVFARGAVGEILSFMVAPLVILGLYQIIYGDYKEWYWFTIGFVLLLSSHMITSVLMAFFALVIIAFNYKNFIREKIRIRYLLMSGAVGLLLGMFMWGPIIEQFLFANVQIFTEGSYYLPSLSTTPLLRIFVPECLFYCYLGISIIILLPMRFFIRKKKIDKTYHDLLLFSDVLLFLGILTWIATSNILPWKFLDNILSFIQFPWRLLFFATLFTTVSIGIMVYIFTKTEHKKILKTIVLLIIAIPCIVNIMYTFQFGYRKNHYTYFAPESVGTGEYLLESTDIDKVESIVAEVKSNNKELDIKYNKKGTSITVSYTNNLKDDSYIEVPLFDYRGYHISPEFKITEGTNGVIRVLLKGEEGSFKINYSGTTIQKVSYIISTVSGMGFIVYIIIEKKKHKI